MDLIEQGRKLLEQDKVLNAFQESKILYEYVSKYVQNNSIVMSDVVSPKIVGNMQEDIKRNVVNGNVQNQNIRKGNMENDVLNEQSIQNMFFMMIDRRRKGVPLAYLIYEWDFYDLSLHVLNMVLIPRSDTEVLIDEVLKNYDQQGKYRILDIGVGSGALLVKLLHYFVNSTGVGVDISLHAICNTYVNLCKYDLSAMLIEQDFRNVESSFLMDFDIIVSNPPYIDMREQVDMARETIEYEPDVALYSCNNHIYHAIFDKLHVLFGDADEAVEGIDIDRDISHVRYGPSGADKGKERYDDDIVNSVRDVGKYDSTGDSKGGVGDFGGVQVVDDNRQGEGAILRKGVEKDVELGLRGGAKVIGIAEVGKVEIENVEMLRGQNKVSKNRSNLMVFMEISPFNKDYVAQLFGRFWKVEVVNDLSGNARVLVVTIPRC